MIVNAAAYTDVDRAECEPEVARRVNAEAPAVLAEESRRLGACLVPYSTDYVFDGRKAEPYTEEDAPNPLNAYGRSKLEGEQAVQQVGGTYVILRTSWVYSLRRPCFVTRILESARTQPVIRVAADQVGSPTWSRSLAEATAMLLATVQAKGMAWLALAQTGKLTRVVMTHALCGMRGTSVLNRGASPTQAAAVSRPECHAL